MGILGCVDVFLVFRTARLEARIPVTRRRGYILQSSSGVVRKFNRDRFFDESRRSYLLILAYSQGADESTWVIH